METYLNDIIQKNKIYNHPNIFMFSWWVTYSYFNNEQIQTRDVVLMNYAYGLSGSFGSRFRVRYIGQITYIGRRINFPSNPT